MATNCSVCTAESNSKGSASRSHRNQQHPQKIRRQDVRLNVLILVIASLSWIVGSAVNQLNRKIFQMLYPKKNSLTGEILSVVFAFVLAIVVLMTLAKAFPRDLSQLTKSNNNNGNDS
jgi:uncharacterized membrane protein